MYIPFSAYEVTYTTKSRKGKVTTNTERLLSNYFWSLFTPAPVDALAEFVSTYRKGKLVKARRVSVILSLLRKGK